MQSYLAESWLVVQSGAAVSMSTSTNFEIKRTVDPTDNEEKKFSLNTKNKGGILSQVNSPL